jgi:D-alanyl-D-alanine dipeptidase
MSKKHPLVAVSPDTHGVVLELSYATANNMAGRAIYERPLCLLHQEAEVCLRRAVVNAAAVGCRLKIFDAFRPHEAQMVLWESATDKTFVADPKIGSNHTRGTAIDLTLVDTQGVELDMGTPFDDMTDRSHHFNAHVSPQAQANRLLLLKIMQDAGF